MTRETDGSSQQGGGAPPFDQILEATLTADGDQTILAIETRGMPLDKIAFYGGGWQIHAENLAIYLAGAEPGNAEARWDELVAAYQDHPSPPGRARPSSGRSNARRTSQGTPARADVTPLTLPTPAK